MKTVSCNATSIALQDGRVLLSPTYCHSTDCKAYPCSKVRKWAKRHGLLDTAKVGGKAKA